MRDRNHLLEDDFADVFGDHIYSGREHVPHGKPAPDVYVEAGRRLGVPAERCGAVEDSHGGIRSAKAAGMFVVAIPNPTYPPDDEALAAADAVLRSIDELEPGLFPT